jgi:hypothetical protein
MKRKSTKIILVVICSIALIFSVFVFQKPLTKLEKSDLVQVKGVINEPFQLVKTRHKRRKQHLHGSVTAIKDHNLTFRLIEPHSARSKALQVKAKAGDSITVAISKTAFDRATKENHRSNDAHSHFRTIVVYEVYYNGTCYQTIEQSNNAIHQRNQGNRCPAVLLIVLVSGLIIFGIQKND